MENISQLWLNTFQLVACFSGNSNLPARCLDCCKPFMPPLEKPVKIKAVKTTKFCTDATIIRNKEQARGFSMSSSAELSAGKQAFPFFQNRRFFCQYLSGLRSIVLGMLPLPPLCFFFHRTAIKSDSLSGYLQHLDTLPEKSCPTCSEKNLRTNVLKIQGIGRPSPSASCGYTNSSILKKYVIPHFLPNFPLFL